MTNSIKTVADAVCLFVVREKGVPDRGIVAYMTGAALEWARKYPGPVPLDATPVGALWPEGAVVECTGTASPYRCYTEAFYTIRSPKMLTSEDIDILRAQGCFMSGQECGNLRYSKTLDNGFEYYLRSVCDSSD